MRGGPIEWSTSDARGRGNPLYFSRIMKYELRQITTRSHTHVYMHLLVNLPTHNLSLSLSRPVKKARLTKGPHTYET